MKNILAKLGLILALFALPGAVTSYADNQGMRLSGRTGGLGAVSAQSAENIYTPSNASCGSDMTSEMEAFASSHNGYVIMRPGDCVNTAWLGNGIAATSDLNILCPIKNTCTLNMSDLTQGPLHYWVPDNVAFDSLTTVSAVSTGTLNKDDNLQRLTVASVSGYSVGDYVKIIDSTPVARQFDSVSTSAGSNKARTISGIADNGTACVITTAVNHGYSSSNRVLLEDIVGTGLIGSLGGAEASSITGSQTGVGRTYNITVLTSTTFSLQSLDNSTDTTSGTDVRCNTGSYTSGGVSHIKASWAAESARVAGVDTVNKYIYLENKLAYPNLYVQSPYLVRYTKARKFSIDGVKITSTANTNDVTNSNSDIAVDVGGVPDAKFTDLVFDGVPDAAILRRGTPGSTAKRILGRNMPNRATIIASSSPKTITGITSANPAVFTSVAHGFSTYGEIAFTGSVPTGWSTLQNSIFRIVKIDADTFTLQDTYGNAFNSTGFPAWSGSTVTSDTDDVTGLGYLLADNGSNYGSTGDDLEQYNGRHNTTTGATQLSWGATLSSSSSIWRMGPPTYITYTNGKCHGSYGVCVDKHEEGSKIVWRNWHVEYPERGPQFGSYEGAGAQIRGGDVLIENYDQEGGKQGIRIQNTVEDGNTVKQLNHLTLKNLVGNGTTESSSCSTSSTGYDIGIRLCSQASNTYPTKVQGIDWNFYNVSAPFIAWQSNDLAVDGFIARDYLLVGEVYGGATVKLRNAVWSEATNTHTSAYNYGIGLRSAAASSPKISIQGLKNIKGSNADYPRHIFDELDATATKYYWLSGFEEQNDSAVTSTVLTESGATTLTQLTTFSDPLTGKAGTSQVFDITGTIEAPTNKVYALIYNADYGGTINATKTICLSGTATVTFKVNTTALGGAANAASSSGDSVAQTTSNTFVAGDKITATVSSNASCVDLNLTVKYTRTLQ